MLARTLITTIGAAAIVAGTLTLSATGASAANPAYGPQFGQTYPFDKDLDRKGPKHGAKPGKGWDRPGIQPRHGGGFVFNLGSRPICTPVYAQTWRWSPWSGWYLATVKVDEKCGYPRVQPRWPW